MQTKWYEVGLGEEESKPTVGGGSAAKGSGGGLVFEMRGSLNVLPRSS